MTPVKFILRYTAVPLMAIVAVVLWASIADAMKSGKLSKWDYSSLVRHSLDDGIVLDWPPEDKADITGERARLVALVKADRL